MKVKCEKIEGNVFPRNDEKIGSYLKTKDEALSVGTVYEVFGIGSFKESILYLIINDYDMISWCRSEWFSIVDNKITREWYYNFFGYNDIGTTFIFGYKELVESKEHCDGLTLQEEKDIKLFKSINNIEAKSVL